MIAYATGSPSSFKGLRVAISGSGNVAQYAALKVIELGGNVLSLSDSRGSLISTSSSGITPSDISTIAQLKVERKPLTELLATEEAKSKYTYHEGARPWTKVGKVDVALPCATQNEVSGEEAKVLIENGARFVAEGSNMGCEQAAIEVFENHRREKGKEAIWYAPGMSAPFFSLKSFSPLFCSWTHSPLQNTLSPTISRSFRINLHAGKAANAGGVAVSGLEMAQNSQRIVWTREEVDGKLRDIMESCFKNGLETAKKYVESKEGEGELPSLVAGSNIAGFMKVAEAMRDQGDWW